MDVAEMIEQAHANARAKGFWESENVAEKLALIGTEVEEFQSARPEDRIEEVADICIRVFDLCGYLSVKPSAQGMDPAPSYQIMYDEFALNCYSYISRTVQGHRKGQDLLVRSCLGAILLLCAKYADQHYGSGALHKAILTKMEKNRTRPHKHGALY